jgi:hypothetical protein
MLTAGLFSLSSLRKICISLAISHVYFRNSSLIQAFKNRPFNMIDQLHLHFFRKKKSSNISHLVSVLLHCNFVSSSPEATFRHISFLHEYFNDCTLSFTSSSIHVSNPLLLPSYFLILMCVYSKICQRIIQTDRDCRSVALWRHLTRPKP